MDCTPAYGMLIKMLSDSLESRANRDLQSHHLTFGQSKLLCVLQFMPGKAATLKELESRFHLAQSTMAGLASRLEKKGLVESYSAPEDRRVKYIRLTPEGEAMNEACRSDFIASEECMLAPLTEDERHELRRMLTLMYDAVKTTSPSENRKD